MADTYTHKVPVRFCDLDPRCHVNHTVYASYCEQAKAALFETVLETSLADASTVVRSLAIEYERSIELGSTVTVSIEVTHLGRTSFSFSYALAVENERVATARTSSVHLDGSGTPAPLPENWRERLASYAAEE